MIAAIAACIILIGAGLVWFWEVFVEGDLPDDY